MAQNSKDTPEVLKQQELCTAWEGVKSAIDQRKTVDKVVFYFQEPHPNPKDGLIPVPGVFAMLRDAFTGEYGSERPRSVLNRNIRTSSPNIRHLCSNYRMDTLSSEPFEQAA